MAKKSLQPIPERESSFLVKSKEVFKKELKERILYGEECLKLEIKTIDDFEMIKKEYSLWHDYNLELLKQSDQKAPWRYWWPREARRGQLCGEQAHDDRRRQVHLVGQCEGAQLVRQQPCEDWEPCAARESRGTPDERQPA